MKTTLLQLLTARYEGHAASCALALDNQECQVCGDYADRIHTAEADEEGEDASAGGSGR